MYTCCCLWHMDCKEVQCTCTNKCRMVNTYVYKCTSKPVKLTLHFEAGTNLRQLNLLPTFNFLVCVMSLMKKTNYITIGCCKTPRVGSCMRHITNYDRFNINFCSSLTGNVHNGECFSDLNEIKSSSFEKVIIRLESSFGTGNKYFKMLFT